METSKTIESLDKSLSLIIDGTTEKGAKLVDWLYSQAPEVVQQLLVWHGVESFAHFLVGIVLLIGGPISLFVGSKRFLNFCDKNDLEWDHPGKILPVLFGNIMGIIFICANVGSQLNLTWLKIYLAPKVYLLEYLANLAK